jgi:hypothetical protein
MNQALYAHLNNKRKKKKKKKEPCHVKHHCIHWKETLKRVGDLAKVEEPSCEFQQPSSRPAASLTLAHLWTVHP